MRIGYCSPFNPLKSGVSDFSEELIWKLKNYMEIVIFSPKKIENNDITNCFETHKLEELDNKNLRDSLDLIVYHVGNNIDYHEKIIDMLLKYQGVLEFHDFGLHDLAIKKYFFGKGPQSYVEEATYCHGNYGKQIALNFLKGKENAPWEKHAYE